jgi:hypothetical protein
MGGTIDFDDQTRLDAGEIGDVRPDGVLPAESHSADAVAQLRPENCFRIGKFSAKCASANKRFRFHIGHAASPLRPERENGSRISAVCAGSVSKFARGEIVRPLAPSTASRRLPTPPLRAACPLHRFAGPLPHASRGGGKSRFARGRKIPLRAGEENQERPFL